MAEYTEVIQHPRVLAGELVWFHDNFSIRNLAACFGVAYADPRPLLDGGRGVANGIRAYDLLRDGTTQHVGDLPAMGGAKRGAP